MSRFVSCLLPLASLFLTATDSPAAEPRPNIILLVSDDQRHDTLGAVGNREIRTPQLDALAAEGTLFTDCFCTTSICAISRATILTGQYARRHGIINFNGFPEPLAWADCFPMKLRKAGYRTGFIGKWGVGGANTLPKDDYDYWAGFAGQGNFYPQGAKVTRETASGTHLTVTQGDQAEEFLEGCSANQPFCLQVSFKAAHCQDGAAWQFPSDLRLAELYAETHIPAPITATEEHFARLPKFLQTSEARNRWRVRFDGEEMRIATVRDYYRLITGIDEVVGRIREKLREKGFAENTVIVYTSDNGFYLGDHGLAGKWFAHDVSIRLPLIVYDPRVPGLRGGRKSDAFALTIDIAPTLLELAGVKVPASMQGRSLMSLVRGETPEWREEFLYEHRFPHGSIPQTEAVRNREWKYVRYVSENPVAEELFHLTEDPLEERNLAGEARYAEQLASLRARCDELVKEAE